MAERSMLPPGLPVDGKPHSLTLGDSFSYGSSSAFHTIRYDFKPASVDTQQEATLDVSEKNSVTVDVPHVEGSGTSHTRYKGNKRPTQKECVLIINPVTGELTLEKISSTLTMKKTRHEGGNRPLRISRPSTPSSPSRISPKRKAPHPATANPASSHPTANQISSHHTSTHQSSSHNIQHQQQTNHLPDMPSFGVNEGDVGVMSDSSSGSDTSTSSDSSSEEEEEDTGIQQQHSHGYSNPSGISIDDDLQLSESDSD